MALVVDLEGERQKKPNLDKLQALVADDLKAVNEVIVQRMESPVALIPQLAGHLVASGGKRLRPILTLAAARMCGYDGKRHIPLAACVEFIHTATLLHDDVVDESELRRGQASANAVWGNQASVLVGDFLFSRAFQVMVADGSIKVLKILSDASAVIAEGEVMQLMTTGDTATGEANYLEVITAKTAELFAAACRIGAVVAERPKAEEDALLSYGTNLGIAFQLVDDAIDYDSDAAEMGKDRGDDFREGKMTLPVILAYARGNEDERAFWKAAIGGFRTSDDDLEQAIALIDRHGAVDDTKLRARHFAQRAIDALSIFPDSTARQAMTQAALFAVARGY